MPDILIVIGLTVLLFYAVVWFSTHAQRATRSNHMPQGEYRVVGDDPEFVVPETMEIPVSQERYNRLAHAEVDFMRKAGKFISETQTDTVFVKRERQRK
jgi:hypothetical protein